ncbi:MAG TPA: deoxyribodipyrimidine photo-lyase [Alphaproteobacteria bacterium]|nr:deoxyribodipyrimidine photo-lyase [Alphaproteobacteria bacterium]
MPAPVIVWLRQDLRLADNPALDAAARFGGPVLPVYILDEAGQGEWAPGGASRWWLHRSLEALAAAFAKRGSKLILRRGAAGPILEDLLDETGTELVLWNRLYEPWAIARDTAIKSRIVAKGRRAESFNAALLFEPWTVKTGAGGPYKVFTPFWKACLGLGAPPSPLKAPKTLAAPDRWPRSEALDSWALLPTKPDWAGGMREAWTPGEAGAQARLDGFIADALAEYHVMRDRPDVEGVSRLSPYLHFGEIGPRQIWHRVQARVAAEQASAKGAEVYLKEIGWREFSYHLLFHFPSLPTTPLQAAFADFPWRESVADLKAWQRGLTGYPIVDAGMRQLWATGWMHNRVRMIVGSFLVKHLLLPWQAGEAWFWNTLVDADLASNSASWQWIGGCGADAAPYFRVFNPMLQGEKFDPKGEYVARWVPELADLPTPLIHTPWKATEIELKGAGIVLGKTYPRPIVEHEGGRARALNAFQKIRKES